MKKYLAIFAVCAAMLFALTACGEGMGQSGAGGASASVKNSSSALARFGGSAGTAMDNTADSILGGTAGQWTDGRRSGEHGNTNTTPNATLRGSYNNPTGTPGGTMSSSIGSYRAQDEQEDPVAPKVRYQLMLDNAHVHDTDGFLLDGENSEHDTF